MDEFLKVRSGFFQTFKGQIKANQVTVYLFRQEINILPPIYIRLFGQEEKVCHF